VSGRAIVAEVALSKELFRTDIALSSQAGLSAGNVESAGKRHSGRSPVRKNHLKTIMTEAARAATKVKKPGRGRVSFVDSENSAS